ncbi:hypothetical protein [Haloarcula halophila]|uniref:hypothetical protein n=1 Tax=Haloarcula halophila TaxID=3032584 RepID=UPI0023E4643C|nr:hypothetical protein [Halomicroarcula sp. DFY41]
MPPTDAGTRQPPDSVVEPTPETWRTDYQNIDQRRRARDRAEAAGASRDLSFSDVSNTPSIT